MVPLPLNYDYSDSIPNVKYIALLRSVNTLFFMVYERTSLICVFFETKCLALQGQSIDVLLMWNHIRKQSSEWN